MTPTPPATPPASGPAPSERVPVERARIEPSPTRTVDFLPALYLIGFLILAAALTYLWQHPAASRGGDSERIEALQKQIATLTTRLATLEAKPAPAPAAAPNLAPIESRLAQLEARPLPAPPPNLGALDTRITALEARAAAAQPVDLAPLQQRLDALAKRVEQSDASIGTAAERAQRAVRLQAAQAALDAGIPLGPVQGAAPALARFATQAPPTIAGLRLSYDAAAAAARGASRVELNPNDSFLGRTWARAQQSLTVRHGDTVVVGDPIGGVLERARTRLDAGDLAGAVRILDTELSPSAKMAMQDWLTQAHGLLDARAALADLAARS